MKIQKCIYLVEGECEQKLINALKNDPTLLIPGKVKVFNIIQKKVPQSILLSVRDCFVVLVFDVDVGNTDILKANIDNINKCCSGIKVITIPQVNNLEEELVRATDVTKIQQLTHSKSNSDFKRDFIKLSNCRSVLVSHNLDIRQLWAKKPANVFSFVEQQSNLIKQK